MRSWRSRRRSLKVSHTQTSVLCGTRNNALLHTGACAQCCADRCAHLSLSKETDTTALRSSLYSFPWTSWCRETITITDKIFAINAEIVWILLSNSLDTLIVKEFNCNMDEMCWHYRHYILSNPGSLHIECKQMAQTYKVWQFSLKLGGY